MINYKWCVDNVKEYKGYGKNSWGLTSSYSGKFYAGHAPNPNDDLGVISPTAALSSFPYSPEQSMAAMKHWYYDMNNQLWGPFGFYDAFSETENYRSGLLWNLFMSCPEVQTGLKKLGFETPALK